MKKRLILDKLSVKSFVTDLEKEGSKTIQGGSRTPTDPGWETPGPDPSETWEPPLPPPPPPSGPVSGLVGCLTWQCVNN